MPWSRTSPMDQKMRFIADHQRGFLSFSELCTRFGISRRTGYKWIERYAMGEPRASKTDRVDRTRALTRLPRWSWTRFWKAVADTPPGERRSYCGFSLQSTPIGNGPREAPAAPS